jgi:hypothetical protein
VLITATQLIGTGSIAANGGNYGYPGGGGRVAVYANDFSGFNVQNVTATGYGAGTIYIKDSMGYRELRVKGQNSGCVSYSPVSTLTDTTMIIRLGNYGRLQVNGDCRVTDVASAGYSGIIISGKSTMSRMTFTGGGYVELGDTMRVGTCVFDSNTVVTQTAMTNATIRRLSIISDSIRLSKGGNIDVSGRGYPRGISFLGTSSSSNFGGESRRNRK